MSTMSSRRHFWAKTPFLVKLGLLLVCTGFIWTLVLSGVVYAAGGVGGGGSGGGAAGGHQTSYGWGWSIYTITPGSPGRSGPTDGFRNGSSWSSALSTCDGASATQIYAHVIYDSNADARIYDYKTSQDSPYTYAGKFSPGMSVDHGKAVAISTDQARDAFNSLGSFGVSTAGFTFGNNVGWFCYNYSPPPQPNGSCTISVPTTLTPGQSFNATFSIRNTGDTTWSVHPTNANRFKLGSQSPQDNTRWGTNRKEIAGDASAFGLVVTPGSTKPTSPSPATFTAPTTPGTYAFAWRVVEEGVAWHGSTCSVTITVTEEEEEEVDLCLNIPGVQTSVPSGMTRNSAGICSFPPPPEGCPSLSNPRITITLPRHYSSPGPNSAGFGSYTERDTTRTEWFRTEDISPGGSRIVPPLVSSNPGNPGSVTVNYQAYIDNYPYDYNQARAWYTETYRERYYSYSGSPVYDYYDVYHWVYYPDPDGSGPLTSKYEYEYWYTYSVFRGYAPVYLGSSLRTTTQYNDGYRMSPCYTRPFQTSTSLNGATLDDEEEVNRATFSTRVTATFTRDSRDSTSIGVRAANKVRSYPVGATYTVFHADGSSNTFIAGRASGCDNSFPGSINIQKSLAGTHLFNSISDTYTDCFVALADPAPGANLRAGDYICMTVTYGFTRSRVNHNGSIVGPSSTPQTVNHGGTPGAPGCTRRIFDKPYFNVFGGDIAAGSGFEIDGACSINTSAQILAWNRGNQAPSAAYRNSRWGGAGTRLADYALSSINEFVSAQNRSDPGPANGLSFANTSGTGTYGGSWGSGNAACLPDYFADMPDASSPGVAFASTSLTGVTGSRTANNLVLSAPSTIANGQRVTIFVNGDVHIRQNISFASTSYADINQIPSVRIVANNIYIAPNVTNIDAVLIAQPAKTDTDGDGIEDTYVANGGNIYTCSGAANFSRPTTGDIANGACRASNLTVRGSLTAKKIYFLRSRGSVRGSNVAHDANNPNIAERIIFSPSSWLADPASDPKESERFEAFASMPPVL